MVLYVSLQQSYVVLKDANNWPIHSLSYEDVLPRNHNQEVFCSLT